MNCCWSREGIVDSRRNEPSTIYIYISPHPKQTLLPFTFLLHYTVSLTLDSPQIKKDSSSPIIIRDILPDPLDSPLACFAIERISSSEKNKKKKDEEEDGTSKNKEKTIDEWGEEEESGMDLVSIFFCSSVWLGVV